MSSDGNAFFTVTIPSDAKDIAASIIFEVTYGEVKQSHALVLPIT